MDLESLRNGESDDGTGDLHQPLLENSKASIVQMKAGKTFHVILLRFSPNC
jgi:hypothetical protein